MTRRKRTRRMTKEEMMLNIAKIVSSRSVCARGTQVGCVISNWDYTKIVAIGYNGPPRGTVGTCDGQVGACGCIHAEVNALLKAPYGEGPLRLFTTLSPCVDCAKLILNSDVAEITYLTKHRSIKEAELWLCRGHTGATPITLIHRIAPV